AARITLREHAGKSGYLPIYLPTERRGASFHRGSCRCKSCRCKPCPYKSCIGYGAAPCSPWVEARQTATSQEADMGMLDDIIKTIQTSGVPNDPRATPAPMPAPTPGATGGQGMSPMAKVLLALLAIYAAKNIRRAPSPSTQPGSPTGAPGGTITAGNHTGGGGLDDLLKGPLGGL